MDTKKSKKILIIEDQPEMSQVLKLKLNQAGFETASAYDGEAALDILQEEEFDLILLDIIIPKIDGFEFMKKLKDMGIKTPIIVLSNLASEKDMEEAKRLGAYNYFTKAEMPITDIIERINKFLSD